MPTEPSRVVQTPRESKIATCESNRTLGIAWQSWMPLPRRNGSGCGDSRGLLPLVFDVQLLERTGEEAVGHGVDGCAQRGDRPGVVDRVRHVLQLHPRSQDHEASDRGVRCQGHVPRGSRSCHRGGRMVGEFFTLLLLLLLLLDSFLPCVCEDATAASTAQLLFCFSRKRAFYSILVKIYTLPNEVCAFLATHVLCTDGTMRVFSPSLSKGEKIITPDNLSCHHRREVRCCCDWFHRGYLCPLAYGPETLALPHMQGALDRP